MEEISKSIWETVSWCMIFTDDIELVAETIDEVSDKLDDGTSPVSESEVSIDRTVVKSTTKYKYLGSVIQRDGEIDGDANHRIQAGWLKWRAATGVLCDRKFPSKLKGKFYRATIRPALLYRTECWPVKKIFEHKMEVTKMRMLNWMCGYTLMDRIRNQEFRVRLGVSPISEKMREHRLRWFGHMQRKTFDTPVRSVESIIVEGIGAVGDDICMSQTSMSA
ncbi:uncharacterized protein LOC130823249 [Amaranthus tricolor]|uniref:uncharacterized protein LOC130823249 n=1 Tax=Amaranthus tricolor TaxID=29722 RepID=UPI00258F1EF9|nr:uncharacterized protein LOC130823249 [Amaranthus tricolor]